MLPALPFERINPISLFNHNNPEEQRMAMAHVLHGALEDPVHLGRILEAAQRTYHHKFYWRPSDNDFCLFMVDYALKAAPDTLLLRQKQLAIICALLLDDHAAVENITNKTCKGEAAYIQAITHPKEQPAPASTDTSNDIFKDIASLLSNTALCLSLLTELDQALEITPPCLNENNHVTLTYHAWPSFQPEYLDYKTFGALNKALLVMEQKHGINLDADAPPYFEGFIPSDIGNDIIRNGMLFNEYNPAGNILHGKYSHRLQWFIIMLAIEKGYIRTTLSVREILTRSIAVWPHLFDYYQGYSTDTFAPLAAGFGLPVNLHSSLLLMTETHPALCFALRKTFFQSLDYLHRQLEGKVSHTAICTQQTFDVRYFYSAHNIPRAETHYQKKEKPIRVAYSGQNCSVFFKKPGNSTQKVLISAHRLT